MKLIYFKETENTMEKYEVDFLEKKVAYVRDLLLFNCGIQTKVKVNSSWGPDEDFFIKNVKRGKEAGIQHYNDGPDETLYEYTYDEYSVSLMVDALTKIMEGNSTGFDVIQKKNYSASPVDILDAQIETLNAQINEIDNRDTERKIRALKKLQELLELRKLNENKKSEETYKEQVEGLFKWNLLGTLSKESLESVCSFFDTDYTIHGLKRYLKKEK